MDMKTLTKDGQVTERLERLGFKKASTTLKELSLRKQKMTIAYAMFKWVREEKVNAFNQKLYEKTRNWDKNGGYHKLEIVSVQDYEGTPPDSVLEKMEKVQALEIAPGIKVFDSYEVAYIRKVPDPLLFGCVRGCPDRFFIDQWDNDISIDELI